MEKIKYNFQIILIFLLIIILLSGITILYLICESFLKSSFIYNNIFYPNYDILSNENDEIDENTRNNTNNNGEIDYIVEVEEVSNSDSDE